MQDSAQVVRLDTRHTIGAELADTYRIRQVPSLLVFNGNGKVVHHGIGIPDPDHVGQLVRKLSRSA